MGKLVRRWRRCRFETGNGAFRAHIAAKLAGSANTPTWRRLITGHHDAYSQQIGSSGRSVFLGLHESIRYWRSSLSSGSRLPNMRTGEGVEFGLYPRKSKDGKSKRLKSSNKCEE